MNRDHEITRELAATVARLLGEGKHDPSADEIAAAYFGRTLLSDDMIECVRYRLPRIRKMLAKDFKLDVCLVNRDYYEYYRHNPPENDAEARACLPIAPGRDSYGLYRPVNPEERIWKAALEFQLRTGTGKVKVQRERINVAVENGQLPNAVGTAMIEEARSEMFPARQSEMYPGTNVDAGAIPLFEDEGAGHA